MNNKKTNALSITGCSLDRPEPYDPHSGFDRDGDQVGWGCGYKFTEEGLLPHMEVLIPREMDAEVAQRLLIKMAEGLVEYLEGADKVRDGRWARNIHLFESPDVQATTG